MDTEEVILSLRTWDLVASLGDGRVFPFRPKKRILIW